MGCRTWRCGCSCRCRCQQQAQQLQQQAQQQAALAAAMALQVVPLLPASRTPRLTAGAGCLRSASRAHCWVRVGALSRHASQQARCPAAVGCAARGPWALAIITCSTAPGCRVHPTHTSQVSRWRCLQTCRQRRALAAGGRSQSRRCCCRQVSALAALHRSHRRRRDVCRSRRGAASHPVPCSLRAH
jgi:hypothetical protein